MVDVKVRQGVYAIGALAETNFQAIGSTPTGSRTQQEQAFYDDMKLYVTTLVAQMLLTALPLMSLKTITDGKASMTRFTDAHKDTIVSVNQSLSQVKSNLKATYYSMNGISNAEVSPTIEAVGLAADPVTGV